MLSERKDILHNGKDAMPLLCDFLNTKLEDNNLGSFTSDWKSYDSTIPAWLIMKAFEIIRDMINWDRIDTLSGTYCLNKF